jgi:hypothetical protein
VYILGTNSAKELMVDPVEESSTQHPLALDAGMDFKAVEVCRRELKDNKLGERSDLLVFHLTRGWIWEVELSVVLNQF